MSKMLTLPQVVNLLEEAYRTKIWYICMIGTMGDIEGTDYNEIMIGVYDEINLKDITDLLKDVINVTDISHTGHAKPAELKVPHLG